MKGAIVIPHKIAVLYWEFEQDGAQAHDKVVDQVIEALKEAGHQVSSIAVTDDMQTLLDALARQKPELVFNLCETFAGNDQFEPHVAAVLELLGQRFTGAGVRGMVLRQDKAVTKKLLAFHDIRCPHYAILDKDSIEFAGRMRFPLFVKPLRSDASLGIGPKSLVTDYQSLIRQVSYIQDELHDTALAEEYVEGRELYVGVLGNDPPQALPIIELDFSRFPQGRQRFYDAEAKAESSDLYALHPETVATDLDVHVRSRVMMAGLEAARVLQFRDYARVDIRLSADGTPFVVEVNANPHLERQDTLALAAFQAGITYTSLINRIVDHAWERYEPVKPPGTSRRSRKKA